VSGIGIEFNGIVLLTLVGAAIVIGAMLARKRGHLQSRSSRIILIVIVAIIAALVWLGPGLFLLTERWQ